MAHLKKSADTGHLLKSSNGHLVIKCPTTTTSGPTTTTKGTTTTTKGTTTTTGFSCEKSCPNTIYWDNTGSDAIECGANCGGGTYQWDWDTFCEWAFTSGDCMSDKVYWNTDRDPSEWTVALFGPALGTNGACSYSKSGDMEDCPTGTYSLDNGDCGDCSSEITIYS